MLWGFPCLGYFFSVEVITLQSSMNVTLTKQPAGQDYLNTNTGFPLFAHITLSRRSEFPYPYPTGAPGSATFGPQRLPAGQELAAVSSVRSHGLPPPTADCGAALDCVGRY